MTDIASNPHRLPSSVVPSHYRIKLEPDLEKATFIGSVEIEVEINNPTDTIQMNAADLAIQSARVAKYGYDAIELVGEPDWYDTKEVNKINDGNGIKVSSICSIFMEGRDLVHSEKSEREKAIAHVARSVHDYFLFQ